MHLATRSFMVNSRIRKSWQTLASQAVLRYSNGLTRRGRSLWIRHGTYLKIDSAEKVLLKNQGETFRFQMLWLRVVTDFYISTISKLLTRSRLTSFMDTSSVEETLTYRSI